jgi:sec-independent protein translocase protein TatA
MPTLGPVELGLILLIVILVFGAGKLPELGGAVGKTLKEFRQATHEIDDIKETVKESVSIESTPKKETVVKSETTEKKVVS